MKKVTISCDHSLRASGQRYSGRIRGIGLSCRCRYRKHRYNRQLTCQRNGNARTSYPSRDCHYCDRDEEHQENITERYIRDFSDNVRVDLYEHLGELLTLKDAIKEKDSIEKASQKIAEIIGKTESLIQQSNRYSMSWNSDWPIRAYPMSLSLER